MLVRLHGGLYFKEYNYRTLSEIAMSYSGFGENLAYLVKESKVLVVGTGGIGCELLKNLVLTGFRDIVAVSILYNAHSQASSSCYFPP